MTTGGHRAQGVAGKPARLFTHAPPFRHSHENGNPEDPCRTLGTSSTIGKFWIPAFVGMTKEGSGFARFPRPRQRDVAGPKGKVSRSHSHFETASQTDLSVIPAKERVKKSRFSDCAGVLAGMREAHSSENAGAAGAMPGNTAGMRAGSPRARGISRASRACRQGRRGAQDSFTRSFAGMTEEESGLARFPRPRPRDVAGSRGKVSR